MNLSKQQLVYVWGFLISLLLTLTSFWLIGTDRLNGGLAIAFILVLGLGQLATQLVFFLHLAHEVKPRWNNIAFQFAAMVVIVIVLGSMWIMQNLNYHHGDRVNGADIENEIIQDEGFYQ